MKGFVYIISNKSMPGILKIGYTMKDPAIRAQELNTTGVPHPYNVDYEILVDNPYTLEQNVHSTLKNFKENKEWFRVDIGKAIDAIRSCCKEKIYYERYIKKEYKEKYHQCLIQKQKQEEKKRQEEFYRQKEEENKRQELLKRQKENDNIKRYIEEKNKRHLKNIIICCIVFSIIFCLINNYNNSIIVFLCFTAFFSCIFFLVSLAIYIFIVKYYSPIWRDEYLKNQYPQNIAIKTDSPASSAQKKLPYTIITCPFCKKQIHIPSDKEFVGNCPHCKTRFSYPYTATKNPVRSEAPVLPKQTETGHPPIIITCPSCLQKLRVPGDKAGMVRCPRCNHAFRHP